MIAKASTISHGANAIRYSVNKEKADIVKANLMPDDISPEAMYVSPSEEESRGWTMDDWASLSNEFIRVFDSIDLSDKTKRASSKQTNLKGSQYIVVLHRDSKSGILHLHIDANRVDMDGKVNDSHKIGERAVMAANIINERRGWVQSEEIGIRHRQEISGSCMEILRTMDEFSWQRYEMELVKRGYKVHLQEKEGGGVYGYSIKRGNSIYKSSILGVGRNLTPSKIEATWAKLHPQERKSNPIKPVPQQTRTVMKHYNIGKPIRWLRLRRYSTRLFCSSPDIWMLPQVWRLQAAGAVLI